MLKNGYDADNKPRWDKVFKNGPSKICGRQPLKTFTWPILELNTLSQN